MQLFAYLPSLSEELVTVFIFVSSAPSIVLVNIKVQELFDEGVNE